MYWTIIVNDVHREIHLPDGRRLLRHDRYDAIRREKGCSEEQMAAHDILRIHPSFRIIAVGTPPERENPWLVAEVLSIFSFVDTLSVASLQDKINIVSHISPPEGPMARDLLSLLQKSCENLEALAGNGAGGVSASASSIAPSCRQLLRLWRTSKSDMNRALPQYTLAAHGEWKNEIISDVNDKLSRMFMVPFMPASLRDSFQSSLTEHAAVLAEDAHLFALSTVEASASRAAAAAVTEEEANTSSNQPIRDTVQIGGNTLPVEAPLQPELVPDTRFVSIKKHMAYLENIGNDVLANERHILLIGNQGKEQLYQYYLFCISMYFFI